MKKDTISKRQNISLTEEIPKLFVIFQKLSQDLILHGKSVGFPTHKFQRELQSALAESVEIGIF